MILVASSLASIHAGVTVTQNVSPGATTWPGTPLFTTLTNPVAQATVAETFTSGGGNTNHSQTFSVPTNCILTRINVYAGGGSNSTMRLKLLDLGTGLVAPNPSSYTAGTDMLGAGAGLTFTYNNQAIAVLQFDFTSVDQVLLTTNRMYAFEITGTSNTQPMFWYRSTNDTYSGGTAYRSRAWINGAGNRDFALALYATPTNTVPATNGIATGLCTVAWNDVRQQMDGFGGGIVFLNPTSLSPVSDANMNTLFLATNSNQFGLSLLRIRVDPNGSWTQDLNDAKKAVARGAGILASPWSPPAAMKDNNNLIHGSLLPAQYTNYALHLDGFAKYMLTNGVPLRAISIQNEPDWDATYEGCLWNSTQLSNFCFGAAALITNAPVMMPESLNSSQSMSDPTLNNATAAANVDYIGGHLYGNGDAGAAILDYPNAHNKGKPTWMTEFLVNDQTWSTAIVTAKQIHDCITVGNMSAYIWWKALGDANGIVDGSGVPQKRGFVLAQFGRFVRPGYFRIGVTNTSGPLNITAYKNLTNGSLAIVAVNTSTSNVIQTFNLSGFNVTNVTPWLTSATDSLAVQSNVAVTGGTFTNTIPASSVVTFVGVIAPTNSAPTNITLNNSTIGENQSIGSAVGAFSTTDPDAGNTFTYTLVAGTGSANNSSFTISGSNLLTAASFDYETQNSFSIRVRSTDQGGLFFEKAFTITITNVNEAPSLTPISDQTTGAGIVLTLTNVANDPELPGQALTFSLLTGPTNATLGSSSGVLSWRPPVSQANTTNPVSVKVSDNGSPVLSATNNFSVIVLPLVPSGFSAIFQSGGQISLSITGAIGPDYTLLTSTNLADWQIQLTTNSPVLPLSLTLTNVADPQRYFRLQLTP